MPITLQHFIPVTSPDHNQQMALLYWWPPILIAKVKKYAFSKITTGTVKDRDGMDYKDIEIEAVVVTQPRQLHRISQGTEST